MMKNQLFIGMGVTLLLLPACREPLRGQLPQEVKQGFEAKYPGEQNAEWEKDQNGNFEFQLKKNGRHYRADFSPEGVWIETEQSLKEKDLPAPVKKTLAEKFAPYEIIEIEEVEHPSKGLFYDVEIKKKEEKKKDVEIGADGTILDP